MAGFKPRFDVDPLRTLDRPEANRGLCQPTWHAGNSRFYCICNRLGVGDPGMTRTCDLRFRKPSLYPAELRDRTPREGRRGRLKTPYQSAAVIASPAN